MTLFEALIHYLTKNCMYLNEINISLYPLSPTIKIMEKFFLILKSITEADLTSLYVVKQLSGLEMN